MYKAYAGFKNIYLIFILINLSLFKVLNFYYNEGPPATVAFIYFLVSLKIVRVIPLTSMDLN